MTTTDSPKPKGETMPREVVITRTFDAPRALVWKAWTDPDHFARWWGPKGYTALVMKMNLQVGGAHLWCMRAPDGQDSWTVGTYQEIVPMERIVYIESFADGDGNPVPPSHYGFEGDWPPTMLVTVTFEEAAGKTAMTLRHAGMPAGEIIELATAGWNESFDKLAESLR